MDELEIMYLGKKGQVTISPKFLPEPLYFGGHGHKVTVREDVGKRLVAENPNMFMVTRKVTRELDPEAEEALFSDEGLEGVDAAPVKKEKPLSQKNKTDIAGHAMQLDPPLFLDPEAMTKREMLAAIEKHEQE